MELTIFCGISPHSVWLWGVSLLILSFPHKIVMHLNNVMFEPLTGSKSIRIWYTRLWLYITKPTTKRKWKLHSYVIKTTTIRCTWRAFESRSITSFHIFQITLLACMYIIIQIFNLGLVFVTEYHWDLYWSYVGLTLFY